MSDLTVDQRWLLLQMGSWQIVSALCSPEGVTKLMQSCWGSSGGHSNADDVHGAPAWIKGCGWEISGGVIRARGHGVPHVTIKAKEINRYAAQLTADIKSELLECQKASTDNAVLGYRMCRNNREHTHLPYERDKICPVTEDQERERQDDYWRIVELQKLVLARALGLDGSSHVGSDQLELFGASA